MTKKIVDMKNYFLLIIILIVNLGNCQISKNHTNKPVAKIVTKVVTNADLKTAEKQTAKLTETTKIYLLPQKESVDYFKYIFPIITLLLGILLNRFIEYKFNNTKIKKSGKRWLSELRVLNNPIENQIKNITEFLLIHCDKEKYTFPSPQLITTLDCEIFGTLDKSELVEYFEKIKKNKFQEAVENSSEINGFLTILKSTYTNYRLIFEEYKINSSKHIANINKNLQSFMQEFAFYGVLLEQELGIDPITDLRYKPIFDLMESEIAPYIENSNYDIYELNDNFFKPLTVILSNLRLDNRTLPMIENCRNCIIEVKAIKMEKQYLETNFMNFQKSYTKSKNWLPEIIKLIE